MIQAYFDHSQLCRDVKRDGIPLGRDGTGRDGTGRHRKAKTEMTQRVKWKNQSCFLRMRKNRQNADNFRIFGTFWMKTFTNLEKCHDSLV